MRAEGGNKKMDYYCANSIAVLYWLRNNRADDE